MGPTSLTTRCTSDVDEYLAAAGEFLRGSPVHHSVLLSVPTSRLEQSRQQDAATGGQADLWLWIERDGQVIAAAQHASPFRAYLSPAPPEAVGLVLLA